MKLFGTKYYKALLEKLEKTVEDYYEIIAYAQSKVLELQEKCAHENYTEMMYMYGPGRMQPSRICSNCNKPLPGITVEASNKIWKDSGFLQVSSVSHTTYVSNEEKK